MRIVRLNDAGQPPSLIPDEAPQPVPGRGELLVRVCAAGVIVTELSWYPTSHKKTGEARNGAVPAHEFSGIVAGVGEDVDALEIGHEVFGMNDWYADGAMAEYCIAPCNFLGYPENSLGALKEFEPKLSDRQVRLLKEWFRNLSSHQAMIMPGTKLTLEEGDPFEFSSAEPSHVSVRPFCRLLKDAWTRFDRDKITAEFHPNKRPQAVVDLAGASTAADIDRRKCVTEL